MVYDLRPAQLDDLGLVKALQSLFSRACGMMQIETSFEIEGDVQRLQPVVETVLFRIAQEAITNISRHAQTQRAWVQLSFRPEQVHLVVHDAGVGF